MTSQVFFYVRKQQNAEEIIPSIKPSLKKTEDMRWLSDREN